MSEGGQRIMASPDHNPDEAVVSEGDGDDARGEARRPPITSFDPGIDTSGADEVVARAQKNAAARSGGNPAIARAVELQQLGFTILPVQTGKKDPLLGKSWEQSTSKAPATFLKHEGTQNYGILPPPGCVALDVDKDAPALLTRLTNELGVKWPGTRVHASPNGQHWFFRWPEDLPRPEGPWWGQVVARWPFGDKGQGYVVGPGSVVDGKVYQVMWDDDIADLPREWAESALSYRPPRTPVQSGPLAEVHAGYALPDTVSEGGRYDAILRYTAHMYNKGLSRAVVLAAVETELAPLMRPALTQTELRARFGRAWSNIEQRLGEPKADFHPGETESSVSVDLTSRSVLRGQVESDTPSQEVAPTERLSLRAMDLVRELEARGPTQYAVPGWVEVTGLTLWAGHPKSMKSIAILQMLGAYVAGDEWLGQPIPSTDDVRVGIYMTREGSHVETAKRLRRLGERWPNSIDRLYSIYRKPIEFDNRSYKEVHAELATIESENSAFGPVVRMVLVIDPMRDFMTAKADENEAKDMGAVKRWCESLKDEFPSLAIILVHHLRKNASGMTGLEFAGSGAGYGFADVPITWKANKDDKAEHDDEDNGVLVQVQQMAGQYRTEPRGDNVVVGNWRWDAAQQLIVPVAIGRTATGRVAPGQAKASVLSVLQSFGTAGAVPADLAEATGLSEGSVRVHLSRANANGWVIKEGSRWYTKGSAPFQQPDVILPVEDEEDVSFHDPIHND